MALLGLNKRQLEVIAETNQNRYRVRIFAEEKDLWQVSVTLADHPQDFHIFTSRGEIKTWRELAAAIGYVKETCPDCKIVSVEIGGWIFSRSDELST